MRASKKYYGRKILIFEKGGVEKSYRYDSLYNPSLPVNALVVTHNFLESDPLMRVSFSFNLRENNEQQRMGSKAMGGGGVRR